MACHGEFHFLIYFVMGESFSLSMRLPCLAGLMFGRINLAQPFALGGIRVSSRMAISYYN